MQEDQELIQRIALKDYQAFKAIVDRSPSLPRKKLLTPEQKARFFQMLENYVCPRESGQDVATDKH